MADRKALEEFLRANGCKNPAEAMAALEPFFKKAEAGKYGLAPANGEAGARIAEAVAKALNRVVGKVIFVPFQNSFSKPEWMTKDVYRKFLNSFRGNLGDSFWDSLHDSLGGSLGDSLRGSLWDRLRDSLGANLEGGYWGSQGDLWDSLRDSFWDSPLSLWDGLRDSLFCYAGFALVNDQEQSVKLKPLLEIMADYLVLGFKRDEPGTLLVLCE